MRLISPSENSTFFITAAVLRKSLQIFNRLKKKTGGFRNRQCQRFDLNSKTQKRAGCMIKRRQFILSATAVATFSRTAILSGSNSRLLPQETNGKKNLAPELVLDFVRSGHTDLSRTRKLLEQEKRLIRAAWEWAPGDFETAIEGASHTGSLEIVEYLLEQGATYSVFTAAALGDLLTIQTILKKQPALIKSTGPHGLTLLDHALAGGKRSEKAASLLKEKGATTSAEMLDLEIPEQLRNFAVGKYSLKAENRNLDFEISSTRGQLFVEADGRATRRLLYQGQYRFVLEGTPAEFVLNPNPNNKRCNKILVKEGYPIGFANRK